MLPSAGRRPGRLSLAVGRIRVWPGSPGQLGGFSRQQCDPHHSDSFGAVTHGRLRVFTGQVGYAWNNVLLYAKGGAAVTDIRYDSFLNATGAPDTSGGSNTNWGGTAGADLEYGFASNWSAAVEYDHIFHNAQTLTFTTAAGAVIPDPRRVGGDTDIVTARINWRFGGPVIAKY